MGHAWDGIKWQSFGWTATLIKNKQGKINRSRKSTHGKNWRILGLNMKKTIYYVTGNSGKFADVAAYMTLYAPEIALMQYDTDIPEIQSLDQRAVAIDKARQAYQHLQSPVLVDDSGIYFDQYHEFPGVLSKYIFQALGLAGIKRLMNTGDWASFRIHIVFYYAPEQYEVFACVSPGTIMYQDQFLPPASLPYDQLFVPEGTNMTHAELRAKGLINNFDHRIAALKNFIAWYRHPHPQNT